MHLVYGRILLQWSHKLQHLMGYESYYTDLVATLQVEVLPANSTCHQAEQHLVMSTHWPVMSAPRMSDPCAEPCLAAAVMVAPLMMPEG
jgi:hypothetical protein